ncbi:MAG TPA: nucleoside triphosphate pyrophosphatase [Longimicrobiales bacterium]|nr:nucleoside triphosphate pyrophosphatase [Longimicrobiales bacterium]
MTAPPLVLASGSPRRTALLAGLGLVHTVCPSHIPETVLPGETPEAHVERLSREKAAEVAARHLGALVLAGDTVVVRDGEILGKPRDPEDARAMLRSLSGREHRVVSGLALAGPGAGEIVSRHDTARVVFRELAEADIAAYVATGEPLDKAGAYGIQGMGGVLVTRVEGDYYTVVGLPLSGLVALLAAAGWRYGFGGLLPA